MHYNDCTAHPYLHSLHTFLKVRTNYLIIGCKLATTEYSAETFFQTQLVRTGISLAAAAAIGQIKSSLGTHPFALRGRVWYHEHIGLVLEECGSHVL